MRLNRTKYTSVVFHTAREVDYRNEDLEIMIGISNFVMLCSPSVSSLPTQNVEQSSFNSQITVHLNICTPVFMFQVLIYFNVKYKQTQFLKA